MAETMITGERVDQLMRGVFRALVEMGGPARPKEIFARIEPSLNLTEHERGTLKTGGIRWQTLLRWYSVDCTKAGYLKKSGGYWTLTPEGEEALRLPPGELIRSAQRKYREWKSRKADTPPGVEVEVEAPVEEKRRTRQTVYEEGLENARAGVEEHINQMGPYEFQNLVAELLRGMGYHVPHVAAPGPDGGVDLIAYRDPLGTTAPRIKAQIKHRDQRADVKDVRELVGLLHGADDIGLLVSSGGFTAGAEREARSSNKHILLMDLARLIELWQEHYEELREPGRALLPLVNVFFLAPEEE